MNKRLSYRPYTGDYKPPHTRKEKYVGRKTKIEWCDSTWNPVTGCLHNCEYCYARAIAWRFGGRSGDKTLHELNDPISYYKDDWTERAVPYPFDFDPTLHRYRLGEPQKIRKASAIFVCSMADLFGSWVPDEWIRAVFEACDAAPQHTYIFLTKNPERLSGMAEKGTLPIRSNWWYGSTVTDRKSKYFPGRPFKDNTFISVEPLHENLEAGVGSFGSIQWFIIGAETGNRKGKPVPEFSWISNIVEAAHLTRACVFMKDSLLPIVGERYMLRELPWETSPEIKTLKRIRDEKMLRQTLSGEQIDWSLGG